jgi:hypothetical protein
VAILLFNYKGKIDMPELQEPQQVTLEDVAYNEKRLHEHVQRPFFRMLEDGTLLDQNKRNRFLSCLYIWSESFQQVMFTRQATSVDKRYQSIFFAHLTEELGHNKLLEEYKDQVKINDPILKATSIWFVHNMFVLDNVEKAAFVHLVLESSGDEFHSRAAPFLSQYVSTDYFSLHAELDERHAEMSVELLKYQHPVIYAKLLKLLEESWDMFETLMERIVYLVNRQES